MLPIIAEAAPLPDFAGEVAADATSLADAGLVIVGVADLAVAGAASLADAGILFPADAAGEVTVGMAYVADAEMATVKLPQDGDNEL